MSKYRTFKGVERSLARRLNGDRTGHTGGADVQTDWLCVEVKTRKMLPQWMRDAIAQAKRNAGVSQLPIAILHQTGQRHAGDLVVMALADFENWFGGNGEGGAVADARYLAENGDEEARRWLEVVAPDRQE
jgi:hypothetical protein